MADPPGYIPQMARVLASCGRRAFTLTELLIVVAIIAILAGLLMPALTMVKQQANAVKCSSNMRQIAMAIEVYRQNADNTFPGNFWQLESQYALPPKVLLCPFDPTRGSDPNMGHPAAWDYLRLYYNHCDPSLNQVKTSYQYESCGWNLNPYLPAGAYNGVDPGNQILNDNDISYFYRDMSSNLPTAGTVSWADAKAHEQALGNQDASGHWGVPFPTSVVPVLRCYFHYNWNNISGDKLSQPHKVNNICMDFNQMWTIPEWELQYNPSLPQ